MHTTYDPPITITLDGQEVLVTGTDTGSYVASDGRTWLHPEVPSETAESIQADIEEAIANPPAVIPRVPEQIGPAQLRIALRRLHPEIVPGAVYAAIAQLPADQQDDARDLWDYATVIRRDNAVLLALASAFELTADQIDAVFRLGATL